MIYMYIYIYRTRCYQCCPFVLPPMLSHTVMHAVTNAESHLRHVRLHV